MKKVVIITISILIIGSLLLVFIMVGKKSKHKDFYVIKESHYRFNDGKEKLKVNCFYSKRELDFLDESTSFFLCDSNSENKFPLLNTKIIKSHVEVYNNDKYYGFTIESDLPLITKTIEMKNAFLKINTLDKTFNIDIGEFYSYYDPNINQNKLLKALEATKYDTPVLKQIFIELNERVDVKEVYVGPNKVDFFFDNNRLILNIKESEKVLQDTFVLLIEEHKTTFIPQFKYISSKELLNTGFHTKYSMI